MSPESAKAVGEAMCALWEGEFPATVNVLRAVRDEGRDYRPDRKSRSSWELVVHLATADLWFIDCIARGAFHFDREAAKRHEESFGKVGDVVAFYEAAFPEQLARLRALSGEELAAPLDFFGMRQASRAEWIGFANNHSIHHRGQLSTHLRSLGSKVPDIYGPSGDAEPPPAAG